MRLFAHILLFSRSVRRDPKALLKVFSFRAWRRLLTPKKESKEQLRKAPFYSEVWTPYEQLLQRRYDVMEESSWPTEILARMTPLRGEIPEPIPEDLVVFVGCDHQYFVLHALPLAYSIEYNAPRVRLHFHVFNPERNFDKIITF